MLVVAIAVLGSLTVLPAMLALLGDRIDKGRLPRFLRRRPRPPARASGAGSRASSRAARWPRSSSSVSIWPRWPCPRSSSRPATPGSRACRPTSPSCRPSGDRAARSPARPPARPRRHRKELGDQQDALQALGQRGANAVTGGSGAVTSRSRATAAPRSSRSRCRPGPGRRRPRSTRCATEVTPTAPGGSALVTGDAARVGDFSDQLSPRTPIVIAFVWRSRSCCCGRSARRRWPRGDRAEPAVGRRRLRRAGGGLPARVGRGAAGLRVHRLGRDLASAVLLRDPVRAVDGLHGRRARADPGGAPRRALRRAPRRPRASPRPAAR